MTLSNTLFQAGTRKIQGSRVYPSYLPLQVFITPAPLPVTLSHTPSPLMSPPSTSSSRTRGPGLQDASSALTRGFRIWGAEGGEAWGHALTRAGDLGTTAAIRLCGRGKGGGAGHRGTCPSPGHPGGAAEPQTDDCSFAPSRSSTSIRPKAQEIEQTLQKPK